MITQFIRATDKLLSCCGKKETLRTVISIKLKEWEISYRRWFYLHRTITSKEQGFGRWKVLLDRTDRIVLHLCERHRRVRWRCVSFSLGSVCWSNGIRRAKDFWSLLSRGENEQMTEDILWRVTDQRSIVWCHQTLPRARSRPSPIIGLVHWDTSIRHRRISWTCPGSGRWVRRIVAHRWFCWWCFLDWRERNNRHRALAWLSVRSD